MSDKTDPSAMAALSICEALLLSLNDNKLLSEQEIIGILRDAATSHENATGSVSEITSHKATAALINRIIESGNSVRH